MRRTILIVCLTAVLCVTGESYGQKLKIKDGKPYIDNSDMPQASLTVKSKGTGSGEYSGDVNDYGRLTYHVVSTNAATVFKCFRVAINDAVVSESNTATTMSWATAVGYDSAYTGSYPADPKINLSAGSHSAVNPNNILMYNAPADKQTGCNAYYEESDKSDIGSWRLPNKRELMLMWIFKSQLSRLSGFTAYRDALYWSASERKASGSIFAHVIHLGNSLDTGNDTKTASHYVRCIKEDYSVVRYKIYYKMNGGYDGPADSYYYGYSSATASSTVPKHPNNKTFGGWNTAPDGSGTAYAAGEIFTMPVADMILYAVWN